MFQVFLRITIITVSYLLAGCAHRLDAPEVRLYALDCGHMVTRGIEAANPCFLVRHPKGDLMWDVGLPGSMAGRGTIKIRDVEVSIQRSLVEMLQELKLAPGDIEYLALSHAHIDHIGNAALFTNSTWIVDEDELTWAFRPAARATSAFAAYASLEKARTQLIQGEDDHDVFGDGSVVIVQAAGHTPGHCVLLLRLSSGAILLAGDIWNTADDKAERARSNQEERSMEKIERIASANRAKLIRQHVLEDFQRLPKFPIFLR